MPRGTQNSQVSKSSLHRRIEHVKRLREMYDPRKEELKIRILFVGESPPKDAPQIFFYNRTSILYYATFLAFHRKFGIKEHDFLKFFKKSGCYLYDLFEVPGMIIQGEEKEGRTPASEYEVKKAKGELEKFILSERPEIVIVVIKQVFDKIEKLLRRLKEQGVIKEYFSLPFPINARSLTKYVDKLSSILDYALSETMHRYRKIKNEWDVAHYTLIRERLEDLNGKIGEALDTTRRVIIRYVEYLASLKIPKMEKEV